MVDYGEKHAKDHNHSRCGRIFGSGLYFGLSATRPLHFLGHSMVSTINQDILPFLLIPSFQGDTTITKMQVLVREGFFGDQSHPDTVPLANTSMRSLSHTLPSGWFLMRVD